MTIGSINLRRGALVRHCLVALVSILALLVSFAPATADDPAEGASSAPAASESAAPAACVGGLRFRKDVRDLSPAEWERLIAAIVALQERETPESLSAYDNLVAFQVEHAAHVYGSAPSLPWHRLYLQEFETALREIDPTVTVPYWDWGSDSQSPESSTIWSDEHLGGNASGSENPAITGPFAEWTPRTPTPHQLGRNWSAGDKLPAFHTPEELINVIVNSADYAAFRPAIELTGARVHSAIGGDMATVASANDPVFFLHYAFIDKMWWDWQSYAPEREQSYGGTNFDSSTALPTDLLPGRATETVADMLDKDALCYGYLELGEEAPTTDTTPPSIVADIEGDVDTEGWHTSDVFVNWTVTDPESEVTERKGCDVFLIDTDTRGWTLTCTATSSGGTASESVTVKRDATRAIADWAASETFQKGEQISHDGKIYEALWWTRDEEPGATPWGPWQEIATTEDGTAIWTASRIFTEGDVVSHEGTLYRARWWTRDQTPSSQAAAWQRL